MQLVQIEDCYEGNYLTSLDSIIFYVGGSISIISDLFLITSYRFKEIRKIPGDLIFVFSILNLLITCILIYTTYKPNIVDNDTFCVTAGVMLTFSNLSQYFYMISFWVFQLMRMKRIMSQYEFPQEIFHILSIGISLLITLILHLIGRIGRNNFGTCTMRTCGEEIPFNFIFLISTILYLATSLTILKKIHKNKAICYSTQHRWSTQMFHYLKQIPLSCAVMMIIGFCDFIYGFMSNENIIQTISYSIKFLFPLWIFIARYQDPTLEKCMSTFLLFKKKSQLGPLYAGLHEDSEFQEES